ncbi:MAG: AtpZ/AtpI family protein [Elusimicrobia bacterium]|nr:AtpZ/AtpI family protein [Candidatus Obscuribacterium magneticum]MCB4756359.1 AtpZ/AtpI family protein [Candidatus Obscuribacterium magneticum]
MVQSSEKKAPPAPQRDPSRGKSSGESPWAQAYEGTQLALTLLIGFYIGYRIDKAKGTLPWGTLIGSFIGLGVGLYNFLKHFSRQTL